MEMVMSLPALKIKTLENNNGICKFKKIALWASQRPNLLNMWANVQVNFLNTQRTSLYRVIRKGQKRKESFKMLTESSVANKHMDIIKNENNNDASFHLSER